VPASVAWISLRVVEVAVDRKFVTGTIGTSLRSPSRGGTGAVLAGGFAGRFVGGFVDGDA
jgi:hypothetical protein